MSDIVLTRLTARELTDRVKQDSQTLWAQMLTLYNGGAHTALGYSSWAAYCSAEFDVGRSSAYRLLEAARVVDELGESPTGDSVPMTDAVTRELAPMLAQPELMNEAWEAANETAAAEDRAVTANDVRQAREQVASPTLVAAGVQLVSAAPNDTRFEMITDAVELLRMLPRPEDCALPTQAGDVDELDEAIRWLADWAPRMAKTWRAHRAALRRAPAA